jgi:hypothetical protein
MSNSEILVFGFASLKTLIRAMLANGVDRQYLPKALGILWTSFSTFYFRVWEHIKYNKKIEQTEIKEPPIFILGHWRSGTTYLHNLMTQDPHLGYLTTWQAFAPEAGLVTEISLKSLIAKKIPETRPMDNMKLSLDYPQEEEFALQNLSCHSFYPHMFPRNVITSFHKYVLFQGISEKAKTRWKNVYLKILKKATFHMKGKRLLLKNPPNTARIKVLLEIFPQAKFIHVYRNPYLVYASRKHEYKKALQQWGLQKVNDKQMEVDFLYMYQQMMEQFFSEKNYLPQENFIEIKFEDLEANPMKEIKRIYTKLNLPGLTEAEADFQAYIASQKHYRKNKYLLTQEMIETVNQHWQFAIDKWQYSVPQEMVKLSPISSN